MVVYNLVFVLTVFLVSYATGYLLQLKYPIKQDFNRNETIDGLRGFLAISVFLHHTYIWYNYIHTGRWESPESPLFNQLGQVGVSLFFMISSFLFIKMIMDSSQNKINWNNFFIRRFFRLVPVHLLFTSIVVLIVFYESNWILKTDVNDLTVQIGKWLGFGIIGFDSINGFDASLINAGVLWSIPYEWLFYFALPPLALLIYPTKSTLVYAFVGVFFILFSLNFRIYENTHFLSFVGGALAAILMKLNKSRLNLNSLWINLILILLLVVIFQFPNAMMLKSKGLIIVFFTLVAMGSDLFGILKFNSLKYLGTISYSTYLLHGIFLYVCIQYIIGQETVKNISSLEYRFLIIALTPLVIVLSYLSYRYIEKPFMGVARKKMNINNPSS